MKHYYEFVYGIERISKAFSQLQKYICVYECVCVLYIHVFVGMLMSVNGYIRICVLGSWRSISIVFIHSPPDFLRQSLTGPEAHHFTKTAWAVKFRNLPDSLSPQQD